MAENAEQHNRFLKVWLGSDEGPCVGCGAEWRPEEHGGHSRQHQTNCEYLAWMDREPPAKPLPPKTDLEGLQR